MPTHPIYGNPLATFTPMVGVSIGLPITIGGFDPLTIDPVFYVDASTSMLGVLEAPPLDLNPAVPSSLDIITATRAGVATYTDASGTIQTASSNTVRVDHVDGVPMMLIEPAATNLIVNSEDFSQDVTLSNCTVQSGFTAPDASSNAYKLIEDSTNSLKLFRANNNTNTTADTSHSSSIFVKAGERTKVRIYGYHLTNQFFAVDYDLISNSVLGSPVAINSQVDGHSIEDCGNGWKRITITGQKSATYSWDVGVSPLDDSGNDVYQGDGASGVYIWGAQLEQGTVTTSYIPTAGSAVTRAADDLVIDGSDFTNFYNQSEGTVYVEYEPRVLGTINTALEFSDGTADNRIFSLATSTYHCYIKDGGVNQALLDGGTVTAGVLNRLAFSYEANNIQASLDGGAVVNDTSASIPTVDRLILGNQAVSNTRHLNGHLKRLIYWPLHSDSL